jgi:hypothetical protein
MTVDPIGLLPLVILEVYNHLYNYVSGNPVNMIDEMGLMGAKPPIGTPTCVPEGEDCDTLHRKGNRKCVKKFPGAWNFTRLQACIHKWTAWYNDCAARQVIPDCDACPKKN